MDEYLNEYIKFTIDNKEKTDNYNMTDNSYSSSNVRMTDREVDAHYEDYMKRIEKDKNNPRNNLRSPFDRHRATRRQLHVSPVVQVTVPLGRQDRPKPESCADE